MQQSSRKPAFLFAISRMQIVVVILAGLPAMYALADDPPIEGQGNCRNDRLGPCCTQESVPHLNCPGDPSGPCASEVFHSSPVRVIFKVQRGNPPSSYPYGTTPGCTYRMANCIDGVCGHESDFLDCACPDWGYIPPFEACP